MIHPIAINIVVAYPDAKLNANRARNVHHMTKAKLVRDARSNSKQCSKRALRKLTESERNELDFPWVNAIIRATFFHKSRRSIADPQNLVYRLKATEDGFTDAGIVTDDNKNIWLPISQKIDKLKPRVEFTLFRTSITPDQFSAEIVSQIWDGNFG